MRFFLQIRFDLGLGQGLNQHFEPTIRQFQGPHDHGDHAHLVHVFRLRIILGRILLSDQHEQLIAVHGLVDRRNGAGPAHKQRDNHIVENYHIADSHHG